MKRQKRYQISWIAMAKKNENRSDRIHYLSKWLIKAVNPDSVLGDVMLGVHTSTYTPNRHRTLVTRADTVVRYCPSCDSTWEYARSSTNRADDRVLYHTEIPSYGKKRMMCPECSYEKKEKDNG